MASDDELTSRIEATLGTVQGRDLEAHLEHDRVVVVATTLDLLKVGVALARDDAATVRSWLARGLVRSPSADERAAWQRTPDRRWRAAVVQPFVLIQPLD